MNMGIWENMDGLDTQLMMFSKKQITYGYGISWNIAKIIKLQRN